MEEGLENIELHSQQYLTMMNMALAHHELNAYQKSHYMNDVSFFREYGICRLDIGRMTGKTEAACRFSKEHEKTLIVVPNIRMTEYMIRTRDYNATIMSAGQYMKMFDRRIGDVLGYDTIPKMPYSYIIFDETNWILSKIIEEKRLDQLLEACNNLRMIYSLGIG